MNETLCCPFQRINNLMLLKLLILLSRYPDDLLNMDNYFIDSMVDRYYPSERQLNKASVANTEASY